MEKKSTRSKLKAYSALAGATLAGVSAQAQYVYTDIDDVVLDEAGDYYDLDLNNDGEIDFRMEHIDEAVFNVNYGIYSWGTNFKGPAIRTRGNNEVMGRWFGKGLTGAYQLDSAAYIGGYGYGYYGKLAEASSFAKKKSAKASYYSQNFVSGTPLLRGNTQPYENYGSYSWQGDIYAQGYFTSTEDQYIGFAVYKEDQPYFGWIRVQMSTDEEESYHAVTIKDYSISSVAWMPHIAGLKSLGALPTAQNIVLTDHSDLHASTDLTVSWDAPDETNIDYYVIFLIKSDVESFTLEDAWGTSSVEFVPAGNTSYNVPIPMGATDTDGDYITGGQSYKAVVFSAQESYDYEYTSDMSAAATLSLPNEAATAVVLTDEGDAASPTDFVVDFTKAADETNISEYRIVLLRDYQADDLDSTTVASLTTDYYTAVSPTGSNLSDIQLTQTMLYNDYTFYTGDYYNYISLVVSVLKDDGGIVFSSYSNKSVVGTKSETPITDLKVEDMSPEESQTDMELIFTLPEDAANFGNYVYFYFIKASDDAMVDDYTLLNGNSTISFYTDKAAGEKDTVSRSYAYDYHNNYVREGYTYNIYPVLSNSGNYTLKTIGTPASITFTSPMPDFKGNVYAIAEGYDSPADWNIIAKKLSSENKVDEYRIMAVLDSDADAFDLASANAVASGNYVSVQPTGSDINTYLNADLKDVDGNAILEDTEYRIFVLAYGTSAATANVLSTMSNKVAVVSTLDVEDAFADGKLYTSGRQIILNIPSIETPTQAEIFNIQGSMVKSKLVSGSDVIDASDLNRGVYIVRIVHGENAIIQKILLD